MANLFLFPISRVKWVFLPIIVAVIVLASLSTAVAQADGCLYQAGAECVEFTSSPTILQRHFVIEQAGGCQRVYDVWTVAERPNIYDQILQPIRSQSPDLQQYNNQFLIRASGEIADRDLRGAIKRGLVREVSRILIDERCSTPIIPGSDPLAYELAGAPPWQAAKSFPPGGTDVLTTYVHIQSSPSIIPLNPPETEQNLVPEGTVATWLATEDAHMPALIEYLGLE